MSDVEFEIERQNGERPPRDFGWLSDAEKRLIVKQYLDSGNILPWVRDEARRFHISVPDEQSE